MHSFLFSPVNKSHHIKFILYYNDWLIVATEVLGGTILLDCYDVDGVNVHELSDVYIVVKCKHLDSNFLADLALYSFRSKPG